MNHYHADLSGIVNEEKETLELMPIVSKNSAVVAHSAFRVYPGKYLGTDEVFYQAFFVNGAMEPTPRFDSALGAVIAALTEIAA